MEHVEEVSGSSVSTGTYLLTSVVVRINSCEDEKGKKIVRIEGGHIPA
jgi:hypothetical protein